MHLGHRLANCGLQLFLSVIFDVGVNQRKIFFIWSWDTSKLKPVSSVGISEVTRTHSTSSYNEATLNLHLADIQVRGCQYMFRYQCFKKYKTYVYLNMIVSSLICFLSRNLKLSFIYYLKSHFELVGVKNIISFPFHSWKN